MYETTEQLERDMDNGPAPAAKQQPMHSVSYTKVFMCAAKMANSMDVPEEHKCPTCGAPLLSNYEFEGE